MKITVLTLFKDFYNEFLNTSIIKNAIKNHYVEIEIIDFREFSLDKHHKVDDYQYGGGPGMVLMLQPIVDCLKHYKQANSKVILTSPSGNVLNQTRLEELAKQEHLIIIAGHYEGFDYRLLNYIDQEISIGDYVLTGGEIPAMVIMDGMIRLIDNVINTNSLVDESFNNNLLDYPVYTKPKVFDNYAVPQILLSGNHQLINQYRLEQQIEITKQKRPDLYQKFIERKK